MKKVIVVALVGVFSMVAVGTTVIAAEGPDGKMVINLPAASFDKPKGKTKAPQVGVTFNHKKHGADLKCVTCHHTQPTLGTDAAVKGVSCFSDAAKCHGAVAADLGIVLGRMQRYEDARTELARAVALNPDNASAWAYLGLAQAQRGDQARAQESWRRALALDPAQDIARRGLGRPPSGGMPRSESR